MEFLSDFNPLQTRGLMIVSTIFIAILGAGLVIDMRCLFRGRLRSVINDRLASIQNRPWRMEDVTWIGLVTLIAYAVMLTLITLEPRIHPADAPSIPPQAMLLVQALIFPISGTAVMLWLFRRRKMSIMAALNSDGRGIGHAARTGALTYLGIMPVFVLANVISIIGLARLGLPPEPQLTIQLILDPASPAWFHAALIGLAIIAAPVIEEVIFRGILLPGLMQHLPAMPAIAGCSLIFAAVHLHLPSLLPMTVLGVGFCVAYIASGSLIAPIVMHAIFNLVNIIALHLVPTGVELPL